MGVVIIILGIMFIIAHTRTRVRKRKIGLPGMGSPIGNGNVMKGENSSDGNTVYYLSCL